MPNKVSVIKAIGLCGASGSGKTTLAKMLQKEFNSNLISLDNYFLLDPPVKKYESNGKNWELPENIDWSALREVVKKLKGGKSALVRKMDWESETYTERIVRPKKILILEGFLLLQDEELCKLLDLSVYIDVPDHIGLKRRLAREKTAENKKWFEEVTFPEYAPRRKIFMQRADTVLNGENPINDNFQIIRKKISGIIK